MAITLHFFLILYLLCSLILVLYGFHHYFMLALFFRAQKKIKQHNQAVENLTLSSDSLPEVLTQIPLYNEFNVAERVIRAVAAIDYPKNKHFIQVLDDSTDETSQLVAHIVEELKKQDYQIEHIRRPNREGYKAGALAYGLERNNSLFVAIFDSDFVPPADFYTRTLPHFAADKGIGLVQARWGFLNENASAFTKAQSVGIDGHFVIEQVARSYNDYFLNFNGTAGVWKRSAINDAGGWNADTLTEDLDLSYRAQLKNWEIHYLPDLVVPAEIPPSYAAFRSQQFRWAKGSIQTAVKMLPRVWEAEIPLRQKVEATFHLTHYCLHLCMLLQAILGLPLALSASNPFGDFVISWYIIPLALAMLGPSLLYLTAEIWVHQKRFWLFFTRLPMLLLIGFGICFSNARACLEGLIGVSSPFVRTAKTGDGTIKYTHKNKYMPVIELSLAIYAFTTAISYSVNGLPGAAPFFFLYAAGFLLLSTKSMQEMNQSAKA
ncbi:glycosyltransferase [Rubritalea tangerina]|uniref:Glycosyltransferase n=1 Tax=Rubritalea tangerina TaxID=430798 RepID=A0ABW4ZEW4_9BACT